jgi:anti-anti-sigma regulatory factor
MSTKKPAMSHDPLADLAAGVGDMSDPGGSTPAETAADTGPDLAAGVGAEKGAGVVSLPSSLTIVEVGELYPMLAERLGQGASLSIDCSAVDAVDGAGLQFLAALNKSAVERQVGIDWHGATEVLQRAIAELGLSDLLDVA